jgi:hypothetical protein
MSAGHFAGAARSAGRGFGGPGAGVAFAHNGQSFSAFRRSAPYGALYPSFFDPSFFGGLLPDDMSNQLYAAGYPVASPVPLGLLQAMASAMPAPADHEPVSPPQQALLIELQGGRYVRVNESQSEGFAGLLGSVADSAPSHAASPHAVPSQNDRAAKPPRSRSTPSASAISATNQPPELAAPPAPARDLPPAILVFRDGSHQEVRDYTIADGVLYARGDFYNDGYWNKKIELSNLNLPETLQENANRSVKFVLPSSPNEVITRP